MKLITAFPGEDQPFEGQRTVILKRLPAGALIQEARLTIRPVAAPGRTLFSEVLTFANGQEAFGGTKVSAAGFVEVDFHARRTLAAVSGSNLGNSIVEGVLLVDLGAGVFMEVNELGAIAPPDDELFTLDSNSALLPGLAVQKFCVRRDVASVLNVNQVRVQSVPTNVSVALDEQPPFWTHTGELTGPQRSTDFADFLQSYLEEAELVDGVYHIPLLIHSDTLARLSMEVEITYSVQQPALPAGLNEVALDYGYNATPQAGQEWLQVVIPAGAEVTAASVSVNGAFDDSRIVAGPKGPVAPLAAIAVTAGQGQAQPIVLAQDTAVTSVDLLLSSTTRAALLDINLLADAGGKPVGDPLLPTPAQVTLDRDLVAEPTWISVRLPQEFQFAAGRRYWLAVQVREGEAAWHAVATTTESESLRHAVASGLAWRLTQWPAGSASNGNASNGGTVAGLYRLRHTPAAFEMPLEVQVGEGAEAVSVSLDRFQPQGNINFTIDFPEFVDAINEVARRKAPAVCAQGEQLQNGLFAAWSVDSSRSVDAQPHPIGEGQAFAMQVAPNGRWLIAAFPNQERSEFWSLPCHTLEGQTPVTPRSQQHLAISADSRRIFVAGQYGSGPEGLFVLDTETRQPIGEALYELENEIPPIRALALHPSGKRLYLALESSEDSAGRVFVVDTALLEERLVSGESVHLEDVLALPQPLMLPAQQQATSLAVSPAGQQLFASFSAFEPRQTDFGLRVYSASTLQPQATLAGDTAVRVVTITPNGKWALLLDDFTNALHVVDLARQTLTTIPLPGDDIAPAAIAVAPDSSRAFVTSSTAGSLISVNLQRLTATLLLPPASLNTEVQAFPLAITPQGDRLYLTLPLQNDLFLWGYLPLQHHRPDHWTLTAGFVRPVCLAEPPGLAALLGPVGEAENGMRPRRPSTLSQVVAAAGNCAYDITFWGISNSDEALAEIIWRGDGCARQRTDRIPIEVAEPVNTFSQAAAVSTMDETLAGLRGLRRHHAHLEAPAGATQAEIRFLVPAGHNALIDSVSFQGSLEQITNDDFQQDDAGELLGWEMEASSAALTLLPAGDQVLLQNASPAPAVLRQEIMTPAGQPFELMLAGHIQAPSQTQEARVELVWQDENGTPAGAPTILAVDSNDTSFSRKGSVPAAATHATLRLIVPPFTTLAVSRVSLVFLQIVTVPVAFIAQAPGELFVRDFHVTYDVAATQTPQPPAGGLCQPTPPGRESGTDDCAGCDDCDDCDEEWVSRPAPEPAVQTQPISAPTLQTRPAVLAHVPPTRPVLASVDPAVALPLTIIQGIGDRRAAVLTSLGIDTLPRLAQAEPAVIAGAMRGVDEAIALDFIRQAQRILGRVPEV